MAKLKLKESMGSEKLHLLILGNTFFGKDLSIGPYSRIKLLTEHILFIFRNWKPHFKNCLYLNLGPGYAVVGSKKGGRVLLRKYN